MALSDTEPPLGSDPGTSCWSPCASGKRVPQCGTLRCLSVVGLAGLLRGAVR